MREGTTHGPVGRARGLRHTASAALLVLLLVGLAGCASDEGGTFPATGGFGLRLIHPPRGLGQDVAGASLQDSVQAYLYRLGTAPESPYAVRPHPDSTSYRPSAAASGPAGGELVLEIDAPGEPTWWRLFVDQGALRGESTFELAPSDREREVIVVLAPSGVTGDGLILYDGLPAHDTFPHAFSAASAVRLSPVSVANTTDLSALGLRFSLEGASDPFVHADPGSRLFAGGDTLGFTAAITRLNLSGAGCAIYELHLAASQTQARVASGSGVLFYLGAEESDPDAGLCIDPQRVDFTGAGATWRLDPDAVVTPQGCEFTGCELAVLFPDAGAQLCEEDPVTIEWTRAGCCSDSVRIELLQDGTVCRTLAASVPGDGTFAWSPEPCGGETGGYAIRVTDRVTGDAARSEGAFSIQPGCAITVTQPNGGDLLCEGTPYTITWEAATCCSDSVRIELQQSGQVCLTVAASAPNAGTYEWIPAGCGAGEEDYAICITDRSTGAADCSDGAFAIRPACALEVTAPAAGALVCVGSTVQVEWTAGTCCGESVALDLYQSGRYCLTLADEAANTGTYAWTVTGCEPGEDYSVRIADNATGATAESGAFQIGPACSLSLTAPAGGGAYCAESELTISWEASACCPSTVRLDLLRDGTACLVLAEAAPNTGTYGWTVERCDGEDGEYAIRVSDPATGAFSQSAEPFTILPPCELTITAPESGATLCQGEQALLAWEATSCCGSEVTIELLFEDEPCLTLATGEENDGQYEWTVSACASPGAGYGLRVTDEATGAAATLAGSFAIEDSCAIGVLSPVEQTSYCEGDPVEILWTRSACCDSLVTIDLLLGGEVCATIATAAPNDGSYEWTAAPCAAQSGPYTIRVLAGEEGDESDPFWVHPGCTLAITAPAGGDRLCEGDLYDLTWNASTCCGDSVRILLLLRGELCATITEGAPNLGTFAWTVAGCGGATDGYTLRVIDLDTGAAAEMPQAFGIETGCEPALLSPAAGEVYCPGDPVTIAWSAGACCGEVVEIVLAQGGAPCAVIASETLNDGLFVWTAAPCDSATSDYTIRVTDVTTQGAGESEAFTIEAPCPLLTYPNGGETLCADEEIEITWETSACCGPLVSLELLRDGELCRTISTGAGNDGSYPWTVERCGQETSLYTLRVTDLETGSADVSAAPFTIEPPCSLTVTSPSGGGTLTIGRNLLIGWDYTDCCGPLVRIELLHDGAPCRTIGDPASNDGRFSWVIQPCDDYVDDYTIRVTDLQTGVSDVTDETYSMDQAPPPCTLDVTSPDGGEWYYEGQVVPIQWTRSDACGQWVRIELWYAETLCGVIHTSTANDGEAEWEYVDPFECPSGDEFRIRVIDLQSGRDADSDGTFTIGGR